MKFALASYGARGDIEPCAAVGRELVRRGHDVRMAVPPNLVGFVESVGITTVAYGPDSRPALEEDFLLDFWRDFPRNAWKIQRLIKSRQQSRGDFIDAWPEMCRTLTSLADGADVIVTGLSFEQQAVHVAEYYGIPMVSMHPMPIRVNGQLPVRLPAPVLRGAMRSVEWLHSRETRTLEAGQRRSLGLPPAPDSTPRMMADRGALELQVYDEVFFPGLASEWDRRRPLVGELTLNLTTEADTEVAAWIADGTPPIYFGFGSIPVLSPAQTLEMISAACAQLGQRALVCSGWSDFDELPRYDHVKVVGAVSHAAIFPECRALVHHGGLGTTATGLRAGVPTLVLWTLPDVHLRGLAVSRLEVGVTRRLSSTTKESLVADLRTILEPEYATRARELSTRMANVAASLEAATDLVEDTARTARVG